MTMAVKICGLSDPAAMAAALDAGADYVGLVFFPPSPRHVGLDTARQLAGQARGRAKVVALTVDAGIESLATIVAAIAPDLLQLHGRETPAQVASIRARFATPVMKPIKVATAADAAAALEFATAADLILFDAKPPPDLAGALPGGNGLAFDWSSLDGVKDRLRWMLSGGLTPGNVVDAIRRTSAVAVDVSSGVERAPGVKDADLIRRFIAAAKTAKCSH